MKRKIGTILVLAMLLVLIPILVDAEVYTLQREDLSRWELVTKQVDGWRLIYIEPIRAISATPIANEPTTFLGTIDYKLEKHSEGDLYILKGRCTGELVYLKIYKDDVEIGGYVRHSDSKGMAMFNVTLRESGYYAYTLYTKWQEENGEILEYTSKFYVEPEPAPIIPAFQIIPAIVALLAVAYLLRRRENN